MIKYAHRGLVEDGKISTLFEKLYILIAVSCTVIFYSFSFPRKVEEKFKFRQCIREEMESVGFNSITRRSILGSDCTTKYVERA